MRIIFLGTPTIAATVLEKLVENSYAPLAVVTAPDKPAGRHKEPKPSPVKQLAQAHHIDILQPDILDGAFAHELAHYKPDVFVVIAYGKIIPRVVLDVPTRGALNIHGSLLPAYRGPSPVQAAIKNGDSFTGVTIMLLDEKMDHGPIVAQREIPLDGSETTETLFPTMAQEGAALLIETLPGWVDGAREATPQDHARATYTHLIAREDGRVDWSRSAEELERTLRAYTPWPGLFTFWRGKRLKILNATLGQPSLVGEPGRVVAHDGGIAVRTTTRLLVLDRVQLEGKSPQDTRQFVHAYPDIIEARLE